MCNAGVVNGIFKSLAPDGIAPFTVTSHMPPDNLNAWPATFAPSGQQIQNPHITMAKVILPSGGMAWIPFQQSAAFTNTPQVRSQLSDGFRIDGIQGFVTESGRGGHYGFWSAVHRGVFHMRWKLRIGRLEPNFSGHLRRGRLSVRSTWGFAVFMR